MYEQYDQKNEWVKDETLVWEVLSEGKCPKCKLVLFRSFINGFDYFICPCGFKIREAIYTKILQQLQGQRLSKQHRKKLQKGEKVKFKSGKIYKGERPPKLDLGF